MPEGGLEGVTLETHIPDGATGEWIEAYDLEEEDDGHAPKIRVTKFRGMRIPREQRCQAIQSM